MAATARGGDRARYLRLRVEQLLVALLVNRLADRIPQKFTRRALLPALLRLLPRHGRRCKDGHRTLPSQIMPAIRS